MEIAGTAGSSKWNNDVRRFDRDDFYPHPTVDSSEVCGSQGLRRLEPWNNINFLYPEYQRGGVALNMNANFDTQTALSDDRLPTAISTVSVC